MNEHRFDAEITVDSFPADTSALRERVYGSVRVSIDWGRVADQPSMRVPMRVIDDRDNGDPRDLPAFVELFFHDAFLLFNLAAPGSFSGVIAPLGGGYRVNEIALDARVFGRAGATLPLADVVAWYDSLGLGTEQIATSGIAKALFHLLHLARSAESDWVSVLHFTAALEALFLHDESLFALRASIVNGTAPVLHPMQDDALDGRVEEFDWTEPIDAAAATIVRAIQERVRVTIVE